MYVVTFITGLPHSHLQGKSSILHAILGEYDILSGALHIDRQCRLAFASQDPFVQHAETIRSNIIFDSQWDEVKYTRVLQACDLCRDFEEMKAGDLSLAGATSGGQRQRIALARCLYTDADIVLL